MFPTTLHTDFARQLQQDRLADVRIDRRTRRHASAAPARLARRLFRRPAPVLVAPVPEVA